jgi:hypothetical protein
MDFVRDLQRGTGAVAELEVQHEAEEGAPTRVTAPATIVKGGAVTLSVPSPAPADAETRILPSPSAAPGPAPGPALHAEAVIAFDSDPLGAQVFVDSKPVGQAPLDGVDVSFGRHLVRMELPGR